MCQLRVVGHDQDPLGACNGLGHPEGLDPLQAGTRTCEESAVGVRYCRQFGMFLVFDLTFRTSALDYPRISFGAKLRGGGGAIPALISPPARCGNRTAVAMAALPTQRGSHAVIHMVGQRHGPHSSREDLGTNLITRHPGIGSSSTRSLRPLGLDRPCDAVFLDPRLNLHFSTRRFSRWSSGRSSQAS